MIRWLLALLACFVLAGTNPTSGEELGRFSRQEIHMGVDFEVVLYASDAAQAEKAIDAAMARIAVLDKALSDYNPESELSRLSATSEVPQNQLDAGVPTFPAVKLSDDLWTVLSFSQSISEQSEGAFDATLGPLSKLWRRARRQKELPPPDLFEPAKAAVGYQFLKLDPANRTAQLLKPNMRLDLGGIAKGYAADQALETIRKAGISRALVRASGDIAVGEAPPGESGWKIGIAPINPDDPPTRFVRLANMAISTSGDARQHLVVGGRRYSHIIDPRTGLGVEGKSSVTVIAKRGIAADSLGTAISILGSQKGLSLIAQYEGAALFMVTDDPSGEEIVVQSKNFPPIEIVAAQPKGTD